MVVRPAVPSSTTPIWASTWPSTAGFSATTFTTEFRTRHGDRGQTRLWRLPVAKVTTEAPATRAWRTQNSRRRTVRPSTSPTPIPRASCTWMSQSRRWSSAKPQTNLRAKKGHSAQEWPLSDSSQLRALWLEVERNSRVNLVKKRVAGRWLQLRERQPRQGIENCIGIAAHISNRNLDRDSPARESVLIATLDAMSRRIREEEALVLSKRRSFTVKEAGRTSEFRLHC